MYWVTEGPVRGGCGHKHRSEDAAAACIQRDNRNVKKGGGPRAYSDRVVVAVEGPGPGGAPKLGEVFELRLPAEMRARIAKAAEASGVTSSQWMRQALQSKLDDWASQL